MRAFRVVTLVMLNVLIIAAGTYLYFVSKGVYPWPLSGPANPPAKSDADHSFSDLLHEFVRSAFTPPPPPAAPAYDKQAFEDLSDVAGSAPIPLVPIKPGFFLMGSNKGKGYTFPVHWVTISRAFCIGRTEITQAQYRAAMVVNPSHAFGDGLPVERVSWNDAMDFCERLTEIERSKGHLPEGLLYRLPTEAEWEYCCRADSTTEYCYGDEEKQLSDYAWFKANSEERSHPVGEKKPNSWGLYDMHGNVREWVLDPFDLYSSWPEYQTDPVGAPFRSSLRRGGSSVDEAFASRSASRTWRTPYERDNFSGFRVAVGHELAIDEARKTDRRRREALPAWVKYSPLPLVPVGPGTFAMGSKKGWPDEMPSHRVRITHSFCMGASEVTQAQYTAVMNENPSCFKGADLPVEQVSWDDAVEFCRRLTESERKKGNIGEGVVYRLPTEAEWEYCLRAGSWTEYSLDEDANLLGERAWIDANSGGRTHPVGTKEPNSWDLYDMNGNVWEWCLDRYGPFSPGFRTDPAGPETGNVRTLRGGSWRSDLPDCRSARRANRDPGNRSSACGFRVVVAREPVAGEVRDVTDRSMPDDYPDWVKDAPFWLVRIDPGSFAMGTEKGDYLELPIHQVTLTREFFIGATEVTQAQYRTVMKENPSELRGDSLPVEDVTWDDAMAFCSRLTSTEHAAGRLPEEMEYRLPTEAEWEYCCRAGSTTEFCFGDDPALLGDYAWFKANSEERSHPVGEKKPNPWGLFDMHGNAWEWCLDHFGSYDAAGEIDPIGLSDDKHRMTRGGSWYFSADFSTSAKRFDDRHGVHGWNGYGLRVVVALIDERPR